MDELDALDALVAATAISEGHHAHVRRERESMERKRSVVFWSVIAALAVLASFSDGVEAQRQGAARSVDWPLHNLDLAGSRFSTLDQINKSNVKTLTPRWLFQYGVIDGVSNQTTPVVVDGVMYVTDPRGSVYAVWPREN